MDNKYSNSLKIILILIGLISAHTQSKPIVEVDYFTDNGFSNTITPGKDSGEYYNGVTYVAYQGPLEDAYVTAYKHKTKTWTGPIKAGVSTMGKDPNRKIDNHGKPALVVDNAGYIHLIFGGHGGLSLHGENPLGNSHYGDMTHVVSKNPQDITSWEVLDNIPAFGTYAQFIKMDNGNIYYLYRHGAHESNWVYQLSTDNARTFEPPVSILKTKVNTDTPGFMDSWYPSFSRGQGSDIITTYNYHMHGYGATKHNGHRKNVYYMVMDTKDHTWRNVQGEKLKTPVTKELADEMTLVKDTGDLWTVRGLTRLDDKGNPHLIFYIGKGGEKHIGPGALPAYYRWTGNEWVTGNNNGLPATKESELRVSSATDVSLLLTAKTVSKKGKKQSEVVWWHSTDGGKSFIKGKTVVSTKTTYRLSSFIRNAHPDARFFVAAKLKGKYKDYYQMSLFGDNGAIKRLKSEAEHLNK
tara:strand:- start:24498 stop:25898 length:1401 start_codon:yes stop_codon:yes gene_type:complete